MGGGVPAVRGTETVARLREGRPVPDTTRNPNAIPTLWITRRAATTILGADPATLTPGASGASLTGRFDIARTPVPYPARNVVGILRGSDPALRGQSAAPTAPNDHVGHDHLPVAPASLRAVTQVARPGGAGPHLAPGSTIPRLPDLQRAPLFDARRGACLAA